MKKSISILGSTGSIGLSTLEIVNKKRNFFKVNILAANKNYKLICKQINYFKPNIEEILNSSDPIIFRPGPSYLSRLDSTYNVLSFNHSL